MKFAALLIFSLLTMFSTFAQEVKGILRDKLVGKWKQSHTQQGVQTKGTIEYFADGTAAGTLELVTGSETPLSVSYESTWSIEGNVLKNTVTSSSNTELLAEKLVTKDVILSLSDNTLKYKDEEGTILADERITEASGPEKSALSEKDYAALVKAVEEVQKSFNTGVLEPTIEHTHPRLIEMMGGADAFRKTLEKAAVSMKNTDVKVGKAKFGVVTALHPAGDEEIGFLPMVFDISVGTNKLRNDSFMVVIRPSKGGSWKLLDGTGFAKNPSQLQILFPKLPEGIKLPETKRTPIP